MRLAPPRAGFVCEQSEVAGDVDLETRPLNRSRRLRQPEPVGRDFSSPTALRSAWIARKCTTGIAESSEFKICMG